MKESIALGLAMTALLFVCSYVHTLPEKNEVSVETAATAEATETRPADTGLTDQEIILRVKLGNTVQEMTMAEYLPGVVRGEMPPTFEAEALKAQAVAERTYLCYRLQHGGKSAHPEADVCSDPSCCNAYLGEAEAREKWGDDFAQYDAKIQQAVRTTDGRIALYDSEPIMAVFHSSSDGSTADCSDVWSASLPYLVSVESPEGENVPNYYSVKTVDREEFRRIFTAAHPEADLSGIWITERRENGSGRVASVTVGGVSVTGAEMRQLFALRSTSFTVTEADQAITFRVTGYGHGVGMSQYGANTLAQQGKTWQEILQWYYTDITIGGYTKS